MHKDITFHKLSWHELYRDCLSLAKKVRSAKFDRIISISRGGLIASRILSDAFESQISHITIRSYNGMKQVKTPIVVEGLPGDYKGQTVLLVDEVSDSGKTFKVAVEHLKKLGVKKVHTASPYIKPETEFIPDFWVKNIDAWIVFPYDLYETYTAFKNMFATPQRAREKLLEIGFTKHEIDLLPKE